MHERKSFARAGNFLDHVCKGTVCGILHYIRTAPLCMMFGFGCVSQKKNENQKMRSRVWIDLMKKCQLFIRMIGPFWYGFEPKTATATSFSELWVVSTIVLSSTYFKFSKKATLEIRQYLYKYKDHVS